MPNARRRILRLGAVLILLLAILGGTVLFLGERGVVTSANGDGLGGRTTLEDARKADYVILTTGDSVSHWKRSGLTVPDVVESLRERHEPGWHS